MKNSLRTLLLLVSFTLPLSEIQASEHVKINANKNLQKIFIKAERALSKGQYKAYTNYYSQLYYYPLKPYLEQKKLLKGMKLSSADKIDKFLTKYEGTPLDWPLRKKWLLYLAKHDNERLYRRFYRATENDELKCYSLKYALNEDVEKTKIFNEVTKLWLTGKSLDKACDPVFKQWEQANYRTDTLILKRIALAADGGKHTLIPYLTKLLPEEQQYLGRLWHQARRNPASVTKLHRFKNKNVIEGEIYSYGIKRLIWRDPNTAINSYNQAKEFFNLTFDQQQQIAEKFVIALTSKKHPDADLWLLELDKEKINKNILQSRLVAMLEKQNWQGVLSELETMPAYYQQELQWKYWYARGLLQTDKLEAGNKIMADLSTSRHYYGFLAAGYLNRAVSLQDEPLDITKKEKQNILQHTSAKRAFELFYLGRYDDARREWRYWLTQLDNREKLAAAKLANENGWFDRTIFTLSEVGYLNDVSLRFPKAFDEKITEYSDKESINPSWAFAIARRESSFMTDANSPVGAKGLMQLMPNTAKQLKRGSISRSYLYDADNNIRLGTKYLRKLLDKSEGNHVLATASYNAGPYRVKGWLENTERMPADIWIEAIPFKETRNYVKSVLAYQEIYQHKPGQVSEIFEQVLNMSIGNKKE